MTRPRSYLDRLEGRTYLIIAVTLTPFVMLWELATKRSRPDKAAAPRLGSNHGARRR